VTGKGQQDGAEDGGDGQTTKRLMHRDPPEGRVNGQNIRGNVFGVNMNINFSSFCLKAMR